jgi:hypothetical protein
MEAANASFVGARTLGRSDEPILKDIRLRM